MLSSVACPALQYFSTLPNKKNNLKKKKKKFTEHEMCVLIFSKNLSETFVIPWRITRAIIINYIGINVK